MRRSCCSGGWTTSDLKALAGMVIGEADRLAALANRLLHHDGAPRLAPVNIHRLLERLVDLLAAEPAPLQLRHDYDPSLPDFPADADRLQQVLLNLARNAREAGAQTLTLRTRAEHGVRLGERMLRSALRRGRDRRRPGCARRHCATRLFQPLVSGRADGSGLGLALSREIAHEHGGELRWQGRPGETVFSLYLPLPPPQRACPLRRSCRTRPMKPERHPTATAEVWVVDDDRGVRFVLAEALRDAGHAVREFGDVASVRERADAARARRCC